MALSTINTNSIADDAVTVPKVTDQVLTHRNLIINGAMNVAQRGTSSASSSYATVDRFRNDSSGVFLTQSQETLSSGDPYNAGFRYFYRQANTSTSSATSAYAIVLYFAEAQDIASSGWDYTSTSSNVTLSFWVRSSLAGTYTFSLQSDDGTAQSYASEFTVSANTWTKITRTIPGNSNLQFDNDNGRGLWVVVSPHWGTDYTDSGFIYNSWAAFNGSNRTGDYGQNWANTAGATFDLTGVQLEVGDTATPFEHRSYGDELARCRRYFEKIEEKIFGAGVCEGSLFISYLPYAITKRANPTFSSTTASSFFVWDGTASRFATALTIGGNVNVNAAEVRVSVSGLTAGRAGVLDNAGGEITFDAEL
ncbi:MAG: hypothetical protein ACO23H_17565 [Alphaproteobacteria bacterium]